MKKLVTLLLLLLPFISFAQKLNIKRGVEVDTLYYSLHLSDGLTGPEKQQFEAVFERVKTKFNQSRRDFILVRVEEERPLNHITITIDSISYATKRVQKWAVAGSAVGLILVPAAFISAGSPLVLFFWLQPKNNNFMRFQVSENLWKKVENGGIKDFSLKTNAGWFRSREKMIPANFKAFEKRIARVFKKLDRRLK
ncbi:hypothetical protein [Nafulsella turpanensis]|uniref:hypothetical protein n=1 Tax=Nafulsella turpanensis TaxID=1265690 RepID=UPI0003469313|nr:hypothetical protein [Nafulsella turpanensis]